VPLAAQDGRRGPPRHDGFWIGFGVGGGSNMWSGFDGIRAGGAGYLRLGGTINQQLLLGGESLGWVRSENNTTVSYGNTTASVLFYPSLAGGLYLKSGLGFAVRQAEVAVGGGTFTGSDAGLGATLGVGYEFRLGNNFFVVPGFDVAMQVIDDDSGALLFVTVGVLWH
jgi:hypothetical protein